MALLGVVIAVLIGLSSVLSAVVAWRASLSAIEAGRYESLAVQQQARRAQLERELEGIVAQDLRLATAYREHAAAARELQQQAHDVRADDPELADELDMEAAGRRSQARSLQPFFVGQLGVALRDDGTVDYDADRVLRWLREGELELRELRPDDTLELANVADRRTLGLIGVAAIFVGALLVLTLAQVVERRLGLRLAFTLLGGVLVGVGAVTFMALGVLAG
ncbi:MAG TPA: hypothetical protein VM305_05100 [Candidatus Limnocylindrales bacterium]|nr:hypothetical protein [Candidatus Limnocylindrales bacterium]